jgi:hypothetical protein
MTGLARGFLLSAYSYYLSPQWTDVCQTVDHCQHLPQHLLTRRQERNTKQYAGKGAGMWSSLINRTSFLGLSTNKPLILNTSAMQSPPTPPTCRLFCLPPTSRHDQWWKCEGSETGELNLSPDGLLWVRNLKARPDVQRVTRQITTGTKTIKRNKAVSRCNFSFPKLQLSHHISFPPLPSTACHTQTTHHCSFSVKKLHDYRSIPLPSKYIQIFSSFTIFFSPGPISWFAGEKRRREFS